MTFCTILQHIRDTTTHQSVHSPAKWFPGHAIKTSGGTNYYHTMKHFLNDYSRPSVAVSTLVAASATEQKGRGERRNASGSAGTLRQRASTHFIAGRKQAPTFRIPLLSNRVTQKTPAKAAQTKPAAHPSSGAMCCTPTPECIVDAFGIYSVPISDAKTFRLLVPGNFEDYGNFEKDGLYYTSSFRKLVGHVHNKAHSVGMRLRARKSTRLTATVPPRL